MDSLNIRNACENDFIAIAELAEKCSPMVTERDSIYHIFTKFFSNTVFVAEETDNEIITGKKIVGFLIGFLSQVDATEAYIHLLCVHPFYRGKCIANMLIKKFLNVVTNKGCKRVSLITKPVNHNAIKFYEKLGFERNVGLETVKLDDMGGIEAVNDYDGRGKHMIVFQKRI